MNNKLVAVFAMIMLFSIPQAFALSAREEILRDVDIEILKNFLYELSTTGVETMSDDVVIESVSAIISISQNTAANLQHVSNLITGDTSFFLGYTSETLENYLEQQVTASDFLLISNTIISVYAGLFLVGEDDATYTLDFYVIDEVAIKEILELVDPEILRDFISEYLEEDFPQSSAADIIDETVFYVSFPNIELLLDITEFQSNRITGDASFLSNCSTETLENYLEPKLSTAQLDSIHELRIPLYAGLFLDGVTDIPGILGSSCVEDGGPDDGPAKKSGGSNQWKTKPTFGLSHQTWIPLVDGGFTFNGVSYDITDNWHTDFPVQHVTLGELNTFEAKVYAEKKLMIQEFLFGIPQVGESQNAELGVEIWYDRTGVIEDIILVQETDIVDVSTVNVTHSKVKCQESDTNENCDSTILTMKFLEPLQDDVMAIKAVDFKKRTQITFLNEGFDISGISLNPMITLFIAGPEKYEGAIPITQTAKYSNLWISDDGREFEQNNYNSFKLINQSFERFVDTGIANTRAHSAFGEKIIQQQEIAQQTINEKYKPIESISRDDLSELIDQNRLIRAEFYSNDNSSELIINYNELSTTCTALQSDYDARVFLQTNYPNMVNNNLFTDTLLDSFSLIPLKMMIDSCEEKLDILEYR